MRQRPEIVSVHVISLQPPDYIMVSTVCNIAHLFYFLYHGVLDCCCCRAQYDILFSGRVLMESTLKTWKGYEEQKRQFFCLTSFLLIFLFITGMLKIFDLILLGHPIQIIFFIFLQIQIGTVSLAHVIMR